MKNKPKKVANSYYIGHDTRWVVFKRTVDMFNRLELYLYPDFLFSSYFRGGAIKQAEKAFGQTWEELRKEGFITLHCKIDLSNPRLKRWR
jgi:hypothetical protein